MNEHAANMDPMETLLREVREMAAEVGKVRAALCETQGLAAGDEPASLADLLSQWLAGQYARAIRRLVAEAEGGELPVELLRKLNADVAVLRKGDHRARQLELSRERNEIERMKTREGREKEFVAWRKERRHEEKPPLSPGERERKMRRIFGLRSDCPLPRPPQEDWRDIADRSRDGGRRSDDERAADEGEADEETEG